MPESKSDILRTARCRLNDMYWCDCFDLFAMRRVMDGLIAEAEAAEEEARKEAADAMYWRNRRPPGFE